MSKAINKIIVFFTIAYSFFFLLPVIPAIAEVSDDQKNYINNNIQQNGNTNKQITINGSKIDIRSLQLDFFMPMFSKKINDGRSPFEPEEETKARLQRNNSVYLGRNIEEDTDGKLKSTQYYSLYDLFGPNISFVQYYGEEQLRIGFPDKLYTYITTLDVEEDINLFSEVKTIAELLLSTPSGNYNAWYDGRPIVGSKSYNDPRVFIYQYNGNTPFSSAEVGIANFYLNIAKTITDIVNVFVSNTLPKQAYHILLDIFSKENFKPIHDMITELFFLVGITLIFFILKKAFTIFKGHQSLKQGVMQLGSSIISLMFVILCITQPQTLIKIAYQVLSFSDTIAADAFNRWADSEDNDVVKSGSMDNVLAATLWDKSIFTPWCKATFNGREYNQLFTKYSEKPESEQLRQSSESQKATGDIGVPTGVTQEHVIKNWAALAYSCTSIYHQDAVTYDEIWQKDYTEKARFNNNDVTWPNPEGRSNTSSSDSAVDNKKLLLYNSSNIYKDDFRWIDALLNVGKKDETYVSDYDASYKNPDTVARVSEVVNTANGTDGYADWTYNCDSIGQGWDAIIRSLFLIPVLIIAFIKFTIFVKAILALVRLFAHALMNTFQPDEDQYNIASNFKNLLNDILSYYLYTIYLVIGIFLYLMCVGKGILMAIIFLVITIYLIKTTPKDLVTSMASGIKNIAHTGVRLKSKKDQFSKQMADGRLNSLEKINKRMKNDPHANKDTIRHNEQVLHHTNQLQQRGSRPVNTNDIIDKLKNITDINKIDSILDSGILRNIYKEDYNKLKEELDEAENNGTIKKDIKKATLAKLDRVDNKNKSRNDIQESVDPVEEAKQSYQRAKGSSKAQLNRFYSDAAIEQRGNGDQQDKHKAVSNVNDLKKDYKNKKNLMDVGEKNLAHQKIEEAKETKDAIKHRAHDTKKAAKLQKKVAKDNIKRAKQVSKLSSMGFGSLAFKLQLLGACILGFILAWLILCLLASFGLMQ